MKYKKKCGSREACLSFWCDVWVMVDLQLPVGVLTPLWYNGYKMYFNADVYKVERPPIALRHSDCFFFLYFYPLNFDTNNTGELLSLFSVNVVYGCVSSPLFLPATKSTLGYK